MGLVGPDQNLGIAWKAIIGTFAIRRTAGLATALLLVIMFAVGVDQAVADPAGNNGTVKVDGVEFESHPNNEPHVGCVFRVDFYGYDEGDLTRM